MDGGYGVGVGVFNYVSICFKTSTLHAIAKANVNIKLQGVKIKYFQNFKLLECILRFILS